MDAVTWTGRVEYERGRDALPAVVAAKLRTLAESVAFTIRDDAQRDLPKDPHLGTHHVTFVVTEHPQAQTFVVSDVVKNPKPANLALWLEFGTIKMPARPFFFPAVNRARAVYPDQISNALQSAFDQTVNR